MTNKINDKGNLMKIYISAFIGTLFLMLIAGIFTEVLVWSVFSLFHASKTMLTVAEVTMVLPLLVMFGFVFKSTLKIETKWAEQGY